MSTSRRAFLLGLSGLPLAACGSPSVLGVDPRTIDIVKLITDGARAGCGLLPTADTIAKTIIALALPAALPLEQAAAIAVKNFCDQVGPVVAARAQAGQFRMGREASTGKIIVDYGSVIINGKPVPITVYA
jgi:hypothetical protein